MSKKEIIEKISTRYKEKVEIFDKSKRRVYVTFKKEEIRDLASFMFLDLEARLSICTGIETSHNFEMLYHFALDKVGIMVTLRALVPKESLEIESICDIIPGAQWIEFECNELLGINFKGNPRTKRFLLSEDWPEGVFPLRKSTEGKTNG